MEEQSVQQCRWTGYDKLHRWKLNKIKSKEHHKLFPQARRLETDQTVHVELHLLPRSKATRFASFTSPSINADQTPDVLWRGGY